MSNLLSSNSKVNNLNEDITNTTPSSTLFCICCLEKEVPYISLLTCSHAEFLNSLTVPEMKPKNKVVCHQCHDMLKKIKLFKLQVEDSFKLLIDQINNPKCSNQKHNLKIHKILDINIPQTNCKDSQQTILNKGINKTVKKEKEIFDEKQNTTEKSIPSKSLSNNNKKIKNIEEAMKIINNNQNNCCINLLATSLQSLSHTILSDNLKILNDFQLLGKSCTNPVEKYSANTTTSTNTNHSTTDFNNTTNITEDNKMFMNETINESVNEVDIVKEELDLPVIMKDEEDIDDRNMQTDEPMRDAPPYLSANIEEIKITREELMQERSNAAASPSFLHSAHRCESCLIGFHYEENLEDHVKRKHTQKEGTINCEVCLQSISPGAGYDEHVLRHYARLKKNREERLESKRKSERKRKANIRKDPAKLEELRRKERERYQKKKSEGKILPLSEMPPRARKLQQKRNQINFKAFYERRKEKLQAEKLLMDNENGISIMSRSASSLPSTYQANSDRVPKHPAELTGEVPKNCSRILRSRIQITKKTF